MKSALLLFILLPFCISNSLSQDSVFVYFAPENHKIEIDDTIDIPVRIGAIDSLYAVSFTILFETEILKINQISEGTFLNENNSISTSFLYDINVQSGRIVIGLSRLGSQAGGVSATCDTTLFYINAYAKKTGKTSIKFDKISLIAPDGFTKYPYTSANTALKIVSRPLLLFPSDTTMCTNSTLTFDLKEYIIDEDNLFSELFIEAHGGTLTEVSIISQDSTLAITSKNVPGIETIFFRVCDLDSMVTYDTMYVHIQSPTAIQDYPKTKISTDLVSIYPNPTNSSVNISFHLLNREYTKLSVYDIHGRLINTILNTELPPGEYLGHWNCHNEFDQIVSSGVYILRLQLKNRNYISRVIILK
ncbi:T9SS type A sorting domain-containing protein [candidate division KSB1 bacterium]